MSAKKDELTRRLYKAHKLAFKLHGRDARKSTSVPVMAHLLAVCAMVQFDGGDEDEAVAALLHDALEDKPEHISAKKIAKRFGAKVLEIVEISSDTPADYQGGPKPPWRERKQAYLEKITPEHTGLLRVTVADKIDNARAILAEHRRLGEAVWKRFNAGRSEQLWYYRAALEAYRSAGFSGALLEELERLVQQMEALPQG